MIRIFIVDDHEVLREGIKKILLLEDNIELVGEAETGRDAIKQILKTEVDVVLLDISLPDLEGLEVLTRLRKRKPKLPILMFTMHEAENLALRYLKAGANGYITKGSKPQTLISAIHTVAKGQKYLTQELGSLLLQDWSTEQDRPSHTILSNREFSVFCLLASGKPVSAIASELNLSVPTISTYRRRILEKMNLKNNAEVTYYAIKNKLVS